MTGVGHSTHDDAFIAAEMGSREREIAELEKQKKFSIALHAHAKCDAALPIPLAEGDPAQGEASHSSVKALADSLYLRGGVDAIDGAEVDASALACDEAGEGCSISTCTKAVNNCCAGKKEENCLFWRANN